MGKAHICISLPQSAIEAITVFQKQHKIRHRSAAVEALIGLGLDAANRDGSGEDLRALTIQVANVQTAMLTALLNAAGIDRDAKIKADAEAKQIIRRALGIVRNGANEEAE